MRGETFEIGSVRIAQNGYHYVKTKDGWRSKHHIIAEEKYGRSIDSKVERVVFKDHDRTNFDPDNIEIEPKKGITREAKKARLQARIEELQAQLEDLSEEIA